MGGDILSVVVCFPWSQWCSFALVVQLNIILCDFGLFKLPGLNFFSDK